MPRSFIRNLVCMLLATACSSSLPSTAAELAQQTKGIKLSISLNKSTSIKNDISVRVSFENMSNEDAVLNLGTMLGGGITQLPYAVTFTQTDAAGKSKPFTLKGPPGAGGTSHVLSVPVAKGAVYSFPTLLSGYWSSDMKSPVLTAPSKLKAKFIGKELDRSQRKPGPALVFWEGEIESNTISIP